MDSIFQNTVQCSVYKLIELPEKSRQEIEPTSLGVKESVSVNMANVKSNNQQYKNKQNKDFKGKYFNNT